MNIQLLMNVLQENNREDFVNLKQSMNNVMNICAAFIDIYK